MFQISPQNLGKQSKTSLQKYPDDYPKKILTEEEYHILNNYQRDFYKTINDYLIKNEIPEGRKLKKMIKQHPEKNLMLKMINILDTKIIKFKSKKSQILYKGYGNNDMLLHTFNYLHQNKLPFINKNYMSTTTDYNIAENFGYPLIFFELPDNLSIFDFELLEKYKLSKFNESEILINRNIRIEFIEKISEHFFYCKVYKHIDSSCLAYSKIKYTETDEKIVNNIIKTKILKNKSDKYYLTRIESFITEEIIKILWNDMKNIKKRKLIDGLPIFNYNDHRVLIRNLPSFIDKKLKEYNVLLYSYIQTNIMKKSMNVYIELLIDEMLIKNNLKLRKNYKKYKLDKIYNFKKLENSNIKKNIQKN